MPQVTCCLWMCDEPATVIDWEVRFGYCAGHALSHTHRVTHEDSETVRFSGTQLECFTFVRHPSRLGETWDGWTGYTPPRPWFIDPITSTPLETI